MVRVGSARSDENHNLVNGINGDQRQTSTPDWNGEVSIENWYLHSKGWVVIRVKDPEKRKKVAKAMEAACNNKHIGYSQSNRWTAQDWCKWQNKGNYDPAAITVDVNVDCSALVRLCLMFAGIDVGDIYTSIMPQRLGAREEFELITDTAITNNPENQYAGDILCTRSSGHTVVVLDDGVNVANLAKFKYVYNGQAYDDEFDPVYYANKYADLKKAFGDDVQKLLQHWVQYGKKEGRIAKEVKYIYKGVDYTKEFDPVYYVNKYADLKQAFGDDVNKLLQHWVEHGKAEGRVAKEGQEPKPAAPAPAPVPTSNVIGIAKTSMTVRASGNTKGKAIGYVSKGQEVKILEQLSTGWLKIVWDKDEKGFGYVSNRDNKYFTIKEAEKFPQTVEVTTTALNIRKGPGTNYAVAGVVHLGEKYVIIAIENEKWAKLQNGQGYISMTYAKKV